jgi:hypothetical protein
VTHVITVEQTKDESYIKSVFLNPAIYQDMKDDSCPESPTMLAGVDLRAIPGFFLRALVDGVPAGVWWLIWKGDKVEAHTALLDNCRGRDAIRATKKAIEWVWANTGATAITSYAWSDSPAVHWFCRAVGMSPTEKKAWHATRNGHAVDITYFNINRPKEGA